MGFILLIHEKIKQYNKKWDCNVSEALNAKYKYRDRGMSYHIHHIALHRKIPLLIISNNYNK